MLGDEGVDAEKSIAALTRAFAGRRGTGSGSVRASLSRYERMVAGSQRVNLRLRKVSNRTCPRSSRSNDAVERSRDSRAVSAQIRGENRVSGTHRVGLRPKASISLRGERKRAPGGALGLIGQHQMFQTRQVPCILRPPIARCLKHYFFEPEPPQSPQGQPQHGQPPSANALTSSLHKLDLARPWRRARFGWALEPLHRLKLAL